MSFFSCCGGIFLFYSCSMWFFVMQFLFHLISQFFRKTKCANINCAFLQQTPPPKQTLLLVGSFSKNQCNQSNVTRFPETHSGKNLGRNRAGSNLSRLCWSFSRNGSPASSQEETITNDHDRISYRVFFLSRWWIKRVVLFC